MQTILGAGGTIGLPMARILADYTDRVRLVSRNPEKIIPANEVYPADLLNPNEVKAAVADSDVVYLLVGLPYKARIWKTHWPAVMRNVIDACRESGSKLVFFDNIYMYDRDCLSADCVHSFTYTPDAARGTAMLGNTDDAYGDVWHLPTATRPLTGRAWVDAIAAEMDAEPRLQVVTRPLLAAMSLLSPTLREVREMSYQYDRDYDFSSEKFDQRFDFKPTDYEQGIRETVAADYL